jgi:hypothetical protein
VWLDSTKAHTDGGGLACCIDDALRGLRLGIDLEAEALISNSGVDAYRIARRRAEESSSQQIGEPRIEAGSSTASSTAFVRQCVTSTTVTS